MVYAPQPYVTTSNKNRQQHHQQQHTQTTSQPHKSYATSGGSYVPQAANSSSAYVPTSSSPSTTYNASKSDLPDFSQALDFPPPTTSTAPVAAYGAPAPGVSTYGAPAPGVSTYGAPIVGSRTPAYASTTSKVSYGSVPAESGGYSSVVATPVNNTGGYGTGSGYGEGNELPVGAVGVAASALNSSTYTGGPTGGLISEGNPTQCHKVDYEIKGHEMQIVEIELDPSEGAIAEAGAMMYMDEGIDFKTKFGDGSTPKEGFFKKLMSAGGRLLMGESLFITHFSNQGNARARVAFAAPYPGTILPMNLQNLNGKIICQKDAFLCAAKGTKLSMHFNKKIGSGLFGGEGFILQKLEGDGMAFVHAGGMVIKRELRGEKLRIDTGCVVAFTDGISFDIQFSPGLKSMIFGGEGLFLATLQGTGTVWMQSLPLSRLADRIVQSAPSAGGRRVDEGSMLTGRLGDMINGDGSGFSMPNNLGRPTASNLMNYGGGGGGGSLAMAAQLNKFSNDIMLNYAI